MTENFNYIKPFEQNSTKCNLSELYIKLIRDMVSQLLHSSPGKRIWKNNKSNNCWTYDYRETERSTYSEWSKFAFKRSIYSKKTMININNINHFTKQGNILIKKNYGLSGKQLINILEKSLIKPLTERQGNILEEAFFYFLGYINDFEKLYNQKYIEEEDDFIIFEGVSGEIIGYGKKD